MRTTTRLLSAAEVARILGRSEGAVRIMVQRKQLPFRRIGHRVHFLESEIIDLVNNAPGYRLAELRTWAVPKR
ncbi:MAG: helix-turn-helix domain-containing protein [Acidobacteriota bacterium]